MISRRFLSLIPVIAVLACCHATLARAATPAEYNRIVASSAVRLESAISQERVHPGSADKTLGDISRSIPTSITVENSDGMKIRADLSWAKSNISYARRLKGKKRTERLQDVLACLRTFEDASSAGGTGETTSPELARNTLAQTLADKAYQESLGESLVQRVVAAVMNFLAQILGPGTGEVIGWALLVGLLLGATALLVFLTLHLLNSRSPRKERVGPTTIRQARGERPTTEGLLLQAEGDARAGRLREAFRSIYLAAILHLDSRRFVTYEDGTTNWEYTRSARRQAPPDTADLFCNMTMRFDNLIYGQRTITDDEYAGFRRMYQELEETV